MCVCVCVCACAHVYAFCVAERHNYAHFMLHPMVTLCSGQDINTLTGASSFAYIVALQSESFASVIGKSKENNINDWEGQMYSVCHCMCTVNVCTTVTHTSKITRLCFQT